MTDWRSRRFGRSAATYHEATPVQAQMAHVLAGMLEPDLAPATILEMGSGTGHFTQALRNRFPHAQILATDLSGAMLRQAQHRLGHLSNLRWEILDGREPRHTEAPFDLVASNAMVQWFPDLDLHLHACRSLLGSQGTLAIGGFCHDHFPELDAILRSDEFAYPPGPGHDPALLPDILVSTGFRAWRLESFSWPRTYTSAAAFLGHLRESGANRPPPDGQSLGKERLKRLLTRIEERCATPDGIEITWKPWFLVAS
ncbi:MAG: methyltransferase domain-containing protein [Fibrobacteres bacterium]|nr:methyltransferase domain-containing protein [Fibrobacterota bacterium]